MLELVALDALCLEIVKLVIDTLGVEPRSRFFDRVSVFDAVELERHFSVPALSWFECSHKCALDDGTFSLVTGAAYVNPRNRRSRFERDIGYA